MKTTIDRDGESVEVEVPVTVKCSSCKEIYATAVILQKWIAIPFYDPDTHTFYCGCDGWD